MPADAVADCRRAGLFWTAARRPSCTATPLTLAREATTAWEAANGWIIEPSYAQHKLELLRSGRHGFG
jgi:hypothetical protein